MKLSPKFLIFLIVFINFLGYGIVFPILPLLTIQYGGNPLISGFLIGIFSLMQVIFMPILGRLSDSFGRKPLLLFFLGMTVFSIGNSFLLPVIQALASEKSSEHEQGGSMGILQSFGSIGRIFGPIMKDMHYLNLRYQQAATLPLPLLQPGSPLLRRFDLSTYRQNFPQRFFSHPPKEKIIFPLHFPLSQWLNQSFADIFPFFLS